MCSHIRIVQWTRNFLFQHSVALCNNPGQRQIVFASIGVGVNKYSLCGIRSLISYPDKISRLLFYAVTGWEIWRPSQRFQYLFTDSCFFVFF